MQKAVVNTIVSKRDYKDQDGFREMQMATWFSAPKFFVMIKKV